MSGRQLLLIVLVGLLVAVGLLFYFMGESAWRLWNIPVMLPSFADTRSILAGVDAQRAGHDPLFANPLDPFGRVMAYPRLWLLLGLLPLTAADTPVVAAVEMALFLAALFFFAGKVERRTVPWMAAMLISPAVMLCFERANTDLVAFFLLAVALALLARLPALSLPVTELAALLKLYPIVGLGMFLRESQSRMVTWFAAGLSVFGLYLAFTWRDVWQVLSMASKGVGFNYGATALGLWLFDMTGSASLKALAVGLSYAAAYALLLISLYRSHRDRPAPAVGGPSLDAFRVGALLYVGTFLQGNTWNYRLLFLIFAIPQLVEWLRGDAGSWRRTALTTLWLMLLSAWLPLLGASEPPGRTFLAVVQLLCDELCNWLLFAAFAYLLFATMPAWIHEQVALFFDKYGKRVPPRTPA